MHSLLRACRVGLVTAACLLLANLAAPQDVVGRFTIARKATYSQTRGRFVAAKDQDLVRNGNLVRTARRGFGEITFTDESVLRINESTEMEIQDADRLRRMRLQRGALWLRVTKGSGTSIQTPVATATVRGTELTIEDDGDMSVIDGEVWYEAAGEGIAVYAGERAGVGPDGKPYKLADQDIGTRNIKWWLEGLGGLSMPASQQLIAMTTATVVIAGGLGGGGGPAVPEPASLAALAIGGGLLTLRRRR